jgi:nitrite reductase/ring-hydroxylating ferredoxin subunit
MKLVHLDGRRIVLAHTRGGYVAFQDRCTHKGGSLADGVMIDGVVQCPWHGSQFDCRSGAVKAGPADTPITSYRVTEESGLVKLRLLQE